MSSQFECPLCGKGNSTSNSPQIISCKHSTQCLSRIVKLPRQKSCHQCSKAKARCNRAKPSCSRCTAREDKCEYAVHRGQRPSPSVEGSRATSYLEENSPQNSTTSVRSQFEHTPFTEISNCDLSLQDDANLDTTTQSSRHANSVSSSASTSLPKNNISSQTAQIDGLAEICEQNIYARVPVSPTVQAELEKRMSFLSRIFRTYPRMMAKREQLPPFIHESQISPDSIQLPLSNCFALSRMWDGGGSESFGRDLIEKNIKQEMERLFSEYWNYDIATLVATFQATIIYSLILLFPVPGEPPTKSFNLSLINKQFQELGFYISRRTLILSTDSSRTRPSWQDWVLVNCKRRTMMALYCFEWITATLIGSSAFPCAEIDFLPAPTGKVLWGCATEEKWKSTYDRWLGRWAGMEQYTIGELTHIQPDQNLDLRSEMWLEEADEFGIMFMGLVTMAPGGADGFEF